MSLRGVQDQIERFVALEMDYRRMRQRVGLLRLLSEGPYNAELLLRSVHPNQYADLKKTLDTNYIIGRCLLQAINTKLLH